MTTWVSDPLVGGAICLDLVNTVGGATKERDRERLNGYGDVVRWAAAAGAVSRTEARALLKRADDASGEAEQALRRVTLFRDALYRVLVSVTAGARPDPADQRQVSSAIASAFSQATLSGSDEAFVWSVDIAGSALDLILARAALSTVDLLSDQPVVRVRECERCSWFFVDRSKNGRRRWCSTALCGNRERVRRHHQRYRTLQRHE